MTGFTTLISPIVYCNRINSEPDDCLFSGDIQS